MMNNTLYRSNPIYPRIVSYCDASYGEDLFCHECKEVRAVCPDCSAAVCVTCEDTCMGCEEVVF